MNIQITPIRKFVAHSNRVLQIAVRVGWLPGARYSNLRDVRKFDRLGFLDIDWKNYNFAAHLTATKATQPMITVARDIEQRHTLHQILDEAHKLSEYAEKIIIVPKDIRLQDDMDVLIPRKFLLGFSVPTRYGGTQIPLQSFGNRPVHLLGGRPDTQRRLADKLNVASLDCNRFTLDAAFGDYFDGVRFRPHPVGGYDLCVSDSLENINGLWSSYLGPSGDIDAH